MQVIIIGAGISGLTLAWKLLEQGIAVDILEGASEIGGLAGTMRKDGYCIDHGPHSFFTEDHEIHEIVMNLFDKPLPPITRQVKLKLRAQTLEYPFTITGILFQMGILNGILSGLSFVKSKLFRRHVKPPPGEDLSVEDWAIKSFGMHLYQIFFKPYTEQFWLTPCSELSVRSIPSNTRLSFINTLKLLILKKITSRGDSVIERERLPTYYPPTGYAEIPERIAERVLSAGGCIHLNSRVTEIHNEGRSRMAVSYREGDVEKRMEGSYVASTIPLDVFVKTLRPAPPDDIRVAGERLDYRPLLNLCLVTEKQDVLDCMYMYTLDRPYNRITELNRFSPTTSPDNENVLMLEIPCVRGSDEWNMPAEAHFERCIGSLEDDGIISRSEVKKLFLIKAGYAYPVYKKDYAVNLVRLTEYIESQDGLGSLGRCGEYRYMDLDVCMRRAMNFADALMPALTNSDGSN